MGKSNIEMDVNRILKWMKIASSNKLLVVGILSQRCPGDKPAPVSVSILFGLCCLAALKCAG